MKILLLGSGGREHAFAWLLAKSPLCEKLYIAPGNAGTADCGVNVPLNALDFNAVYEFCKEFEIDLLIPAAEEPLVKGIVDFIKLRNTHEGTKIEVVGPAKWPAQLEGSKDFSKEFMQRHNIPTGAFKTITLENLAEGKSFLASLKPPYVLKADGLAAGKGVIITENLKEAESVLDEMILHQKFGEASARVVIEEFLHGIEISVFAVSDGKDWKILASAKDYKRIGEGDTGPNTGGMGAISPVPFADEVFMGKVSEQIAAPTFDGLIKEGHPFQGFLFIGLMNCNGNPMVIEYNVRMGDPETEAIFPRLKTDMVELLQSMTDGTLKDLDLQLDHRTAATVFMVSGGYPGEYEKGKPMQIPAAPEDTYLFHAGTAKKEESVVTNGGRVLAITSMADSIAAAVQKALNFAEAVTFENAYYRTDIGQDLISLQQKQQNDI